MTNTRLQQTVSFTRMEAGTKEDYALLDRLEKAYISALPQRILSALENLHAALAAIRSRALNILCKPPHGQKKMAQISS